MTRIVRTSFSVSKSKSGEKSQYEHDPDTYKAKGIQLLGSWFVEAFIPAFAATRDYGKEFVQHISGGKFKMPSRNTVMKAMTSDTGPVADAVRNDFAEFIVPR